MGELTVRGRCVAEWVVWVAAALLATWLTPVIAIGGRIWGLYPGLGLVLVAIMAAATWKVRHGVDARGARLWAACVWLLAAGLLEVVAFGSLPNTPFDASWLPPVFAILLGPPILGAGVFEISRRRVWRSAPPAAAMSSG